jgi:hypothetical protein
MREGEKAIFQELLASVSSKHLLLPEEALTGFMAMVGGNFNHGLMVVGRAVNGWTEGWLPRDLIDAGRVERVGQKTLESVTRSDGCPMTWVTECWGNNDNYNTRRSAFWRVIRRTIAGLGLADVDTDDWPSVLVWSKLYKIAPAVGGNPSSALCDMQGAHCTRLLRAEIEAYRPQRLLFLTGIGWAEPFLEGWTVPYRSSLDYSYVESVLEWSLAEDQEPGRIVVAAHPQGKNEDLWVAEVLHAFK